MTRAQSLSTSVENLVEFDQAPFHIGFTEHPSNPAPFPDLLPLHLGVEIETGVIRQLPRDDVRRFLSLAYQRGSLLGTAMDDTTAGRAYAQDFMAFITEVSIVAGRSVLEIGAGRGYLVKLLREAGAQAIGIEPGHANSPHWIRHGVPIIEAVFPTPQVSNAFDLIVAYGLLEHVEQSGDFLSAVRHQLKPQGLVIFAVPNCETYIVDGDPGMVVHEHWSYYTPSTLANFLTYYGFSVRSLSPARYGSVIYVAASAGGESTTSVRVVDDLKVARQFPDNYRRLRQNIQRRLALLSAQNRTLGVFAAGRAAMWLPPSANVRFFDDDLELVDRYYPPFLAAIESRDSLFDRPVDELWIMSRSFGLRILESLRRHESLCDTTIVEVDALLGRV